MGRPKSGASKPGGSSAPRFYRSRFGWMDSENPSLLASSQEELMQKVAALTAKKASPVVEKVVSKQLQSSIKKPKAKVTRAVAKPAPKPAAPAKKPVVSKPTIKPAAPKPVQSVNAKAEIQSLFTNPSSTYNPKEEAKRMAAESAEKRAKEAAERSAQRKAALKDIK